MEHRSLAPNLVIPTDGNAGRNQLAGEPASDVASGELLEKKQMGRAENCSDLELSNYLQALAEGCLVTYYSDTKPSALSKSISIASRSYRQGRQTVHFHGFPSLEMSRYSTAIRGEELLTWYLAGFRAKTSALPEAGPDWTAKGQGYGQKWLGSLAKYDPDTHSLKTAQLSLLEDSTECCPTLPRWGLLAVGASLQPQMLERHTGEKESGFLGAGNGKQNAKIHQGIPNLVLSAMWNGDEKRSVSIWSIDGFGPVYEAEILLEGMPECFFSERRIEKPSEQMALSLPEKGMLRALFLAKEFTSASQRQGHIEQLTDEFADALRELSQHVALEGAQGKWSVNLNGELYPQPMLEPRTAESESGYWPTPTVCGNHNRKGASATSGDGLATAVKMWPTATATATAYKGWSPNHNRADTDDRLDYSVERESFQPGQQTPPMRLNPDWVEWLMGWPIGQTALKPLETGRCHCAQPLHGDCLQTFDCWKRHFSR